MPGLEKVNKKIKDQLNKIKKQREHIQEQIFIIDKIIRNNKINHEKKIIKTHKN